MAVDEGPAHEAGAPLSPRSERQGVDMKITEVTGNSRRRVFEVRTRHGTLAFPYSESDPPPSPDDPLVRVFVDPELGRDGFTYELASGAEGSVHIDAVLEYNQDPSHMAELALYRLTTEAQEKFKESPLSVREAAHRLGTSPAQLYRLLDPTNYTKSLRQMLSLLYVLGYEVDMELVPGKAQVRQEGGLVSENRHVVRGPEGGWDVRKPGSNRASSRHDTQAAAERRAKEIVANAGGGEVIVHRPDGRIRDKDTVAPARDPFPPRDKKH